jgi:predicted ATPase/transcriptional regulator with XRE-family HTH domain
MEVPGEPASSAGFGAVLRRFRAAAGLTQEELAARAGLSVRGLRYVEGGERRPYPATVQRLGAGLGLSAAECQVLSDAGRRDRSDDRPPERGAVPVPVNPLIGREQQVSAVVTLLTRRDVRCVTLTGPGGVGKTRLAMQAATDLSVAFGDGVVWVSLAAVADPGLVPSAIIQGLGMAHTGGPGVPDAIIASLRDSELLLVLDNFEHVDSAAPIVAALLSGCPQVKVLLTSRAALRLYAEHEYPLGPLPVPGPGPQASVFQLATNPAVDLFLRRAQAVKPDFTLDAVNATAVAAVCRRLDGLPLAIELAAPWIRVLPPAAMLERLDSGLTLAMAGARDLPARQHTMRDTIGWSHQLLNPHLQTLFRRLAVFEGGATLPAVEAVARGSGDRSDIDVLETLQELQRHSLIQVDDAPAGEPRIRMLSTIREFAAARLAESGEADTVEGRHLGYYQTLAEEATAHLFGPDAAAWLPKLEFEHDNFRAALRRSTAHDPLPGLRLAAALWGFWYVRGYTTEGRTHLTALLELTQHAAPPRIRAEALLGAGQLAHTQGDFTAATTLLTDCVALYRQVGDSRKTAEALLGAGFAARLQEDYVQAQTLLGEALQLGRGADHPFIAAAALHHLGLIAGDADRDYHRAAALLTDSLQLYQTLGSPRFIALVLLSLGDTTLAAGDPARAHQFLREGLTRMSMTGETLGIHGALDSFATLAAAQGQPDRAVRLASAAAHLRAATGTRSWPVVERRREQWWGSARQRLGDDEFRSSSEQGGTWTRDESITYALDEPPGIRPATAC